MNGSTRGAAALGRSRWFGCAVIACVVLAAATGAVAKAPHAAGPKPLLRQLHWHRIQSHAANVLSNGRYLLVSVLKNPTTDVDTVLDDQTGTRRTITPPAIGCAGATLFFSRTFLMTACTATSDPHLLTLYSPQANSWKVVDYSQRWNQICGPGTAGFQDVGCSVAPSDVGRDWIEFFVHQCRDCNDSYGFMNLNDGSWRQVPLSTTASVPASRLVRGIPGVTATSLLDLDSPTLTSRLCSPLKLPNSGAPFIGPQSALTSAVNLYGRYAIIGNYLERCGSRLHLRQASSPTVGNSRLLIRRNNNKLDGIFLPTLHRFVATLRGPVAADQTSSSFVVGPKHFFAIDDNPNRGYADIYSAALPRDH